MRLMLRTKRQVRWGFFVCVRHAFIVLAPLILFYPNLLNPQVGSDRSDTTSSKDNKSCSTLPSGFTSCMAEHGVPSNASPLSHVPSSEQI